MITKTTNTHNPFSVELINKIPFYLEETDWETLLNRLGLLNYRATIIGREGQGKTALLRALAEQLQARGFTIKLLYYTKQRDNYSISFINQFIQELQSDDFILLDDAERFSWLAWQWFQRGITHKIKGLITTQRLASRLPVLYECHSSYKTLNYLLNKLLIQPKEAFIFRTEALQLFESHHGNLSIIFNELYHYYAQLENINRDDIEIS